MVDSNVFDVASVIIPQAVFTHFEANHRPGALHEYDTLTKFWKIKNADCNHCKKIIQ